MSAAIGNRFSPTTYLPTSPAVYITVNSNPAGAPERSDTYYLAGKVTCLQPKGSNLTESKVVLYPHLSMPAQRQAEILGTLTHAQLILVYHLHYAPC